MSFGTSKYFGLYSDFTLMPVQARSNSKNIGGVRTCVRQTLTLYLLCYVVFLKILSQKQYTYTLLRYLFVRHVMSIPLEFFCNKVKKELYGAEIM